MFLEQNEARDTTTKGENEGIDDGSYDSDGCDIFISLEWIDEAIPSIELHENVISANCPTCRAIEDPLVAYDDDLDASTLNLQECPICNESKMCRALQCCSHKFCVDCWAQWRNSTCTKIPSGVSRPTEDGVELQNIRREKYDFLQSTLPHTMGGTATKASSSSEKDIEEAKRSLRIAIGVYFESLEQKPLGPGS